MSPHSNLQQQTYLQIDAQQQQQQQAYVQYHSTNAPYPVTTGVLNGHSHGIPVPPLTTGQSASSEASKAATQTRIGASSLTLGASGMYGEEGGFTDLFNAAAVVSNEDTLLMGNYQIN